MGAGVIVREAATPILSGSFYHVNEKTIQASFLKNRVNKFIEAYKGILTFDISSAIRRDEWAYGNERIAIAQATFDPTAAYSVTYLALDLYSLGIAPQSIEATYEGNLAEVVKDLTYKLQEAQTEIDMLRNTKANRQQPVWIAPTLLNAWVNNGGTDAVAGYYKSELGDVNLKGLIKTFNF